MPSTRAALPARSRRQCLDDLEVAQAAILLSTKADDDGSFDIILPVSADGYILVHQGQQSLLSALVLHGW